ncbi:iron chaperone [Sulfuricurvum sp.]|uniref:iron chaperone n=1 Tax=Sulfuricurvum sp. TaxID=2025608 RepID=UPI003BB7226F
MKKSLISEYVVNQPEATKNALVELRSYILEAAPDAIELINYNIPAFALIEGGKREEQIMMAGYKNHIGFYPHPDTIEAFKTKLIGYKYAKGSIQFPLNQPIPKELVIEMVKYRLKQVNEK